MTPACPKHRALVDRALSESATDEDLERYADEVTDCPECRRLLAVDLQVHPAVIDQAGQAGWPAIAAELPPHAGELELLRALERRPARPWLRWAGPGMLAAAAALVTIGVLQSPPPEVGVAPEVVSAPERVSTQPAAAVPAPVETPTPVVNAAVAAAPARPGSAPPPVAPVAAAPAPAPDWSPPAFVDLVGARPKGSIAATRDLRLELDGTPAVGGVVHLAVATTAEARVAVCVSGPERGVVWRGDVPPGRVDLAVEGRRQAFGFGTPGIYTFAVSSSDYVECTDPVHVVEVEVR